MAIRADWNVCPSAERVTLAAAFATAMSISLRGTNRSKAAPLFAAGAGKRSETSISPFWSTLRPGPVQNCSTGPVRDPFGPVISQVAPRAIRVGMESPAGPLLQRLPPRLARDWIWTLPMIDAESTSAGKRCLMPASL